MNIDLHDDKMEVMDYERMCVELEKRNDILREDAQTLRKEIDYLRTEVMKWQAGGFFYLRMQEHILADENIRAAWNDFMVIYILAHPDIRELM